jgi:hypothetical protein
VATTNRQGELIVLVQHTRYGLLPNAAQLDLNPLAQRIGDAVSRTFTGVAVLVQRAAVNNRDLAISKCRLTN